MKTTGPEAADELLALKAELDELRTSFQEARDVVHAISFGEVDAVVVRPHEREHAVYTFFGEDHPYRTLVESMNEGAVTLATDGTILYCNPSFARILGSERSGLAGMPLSRFVHPNDGAHFQAFVTQEDEGRAEMTLVDDRGADVPVYLSKSPTDLVGSHGICLVVTDLTEQKKHDEVVASERLARMILEQASEAIVVCDGSGHITHASRQAAVLSGANPLLRRFDETFQFIVEAASSDGPSPSIERRILHEAACGNYPLKRREVRCTLSPGEHRWLLLSSSPLKDRDGNGIGAVIILTDITEAQRSAAAVEESERQAKLRLEQQVARRTAELRHANHKLKQLNREMQDFAFLASHDLQEPLRKIHTFLDLLLEELGDNFTPKAKDYLRRITSAARRMSDLIRALLEYSRVSSRGDEFQQVELNEALGDVLLTLKPVLMASECKVVAEELPVIEADPAQIRRLFSHVISNAAKFCRKGVAPVLHIRAVEPNIERMPLDALDEWICIEFEDNGIGIQERFLDRIFSPFQQLHGRNTYDGIGMGLAICRRIVERHGGRIDVASTPDIGSTFIVTLPRVSPSGDV